jgi:hypothetical protein
LSKVEPTSHMDGSSTSNVYQTVTSKFANASTIFLSLVRAFPCLLKNLLRESDIWLIVSLLSYRRSIRAAIILLRACTPKHSITGAYNCLYAFQNHRHTVLRAPYGRVKQPQERLMALDNVRGYARKHTGQFSLPGLFYGAALPLSLLI